MLTDDDLTRELGSAFRADTSELTYSGRRRPRRTAIVAVPVAAVSIAIAAVAISVATNDSTPEVPPTAGDPATPSAIASSAPRKVVTDTIDLAGYSFTYKRTEGKTAPVFATLVTDLPDDITPIDAPEGVKAWVGKDPKGDNAVYVKATAESGGALFALHSPVWTQDELTEFFQKGTPRAVALVKE